MLKVPVGTQIFEDDNETLICDLTEVGQRFRLAAGGNGGFRQPAFQVVHQPRAAAAPIRACRASSAGYGSG